MGFSGFRFQVLGFRVLGFRTLQLKCLIKGCLLEIAITTPVRILKEDHLVGLSGFLCFKAVVLTSLTLMVQMYLSIYRLYV